MPRASAKNQNLKDDLKEIKIALCGNPNSGKTCIFNKLTGSRQHVGNWHGVTVERKEGTIRVNDFKIKIVDLPGTYSLSTFSIEEIVAKNFIINEKPDVIINVIDSTNLERNLYLTTQLIELGAKVVIALNMSDEAFHKGILIDKKNMAQLLGMPIVPTVGNKGRGLQELLKEVIAVAQNTEPIVRHLHINYGHEVEKELKKIQTELRKDPNITESYSTRWLAIKLLEHDKQLQNDIEKISSHCNEIKQQLEISHHRIENILNEESEIIFAERRYGFIKGLLEQVYQHRVTTQLDLSDKIDKILTNKFLGIPLLLAFLWLMFQTTFVLGAYPMNWIDSAVSAVSTFAANVLPAGLIKDLIVDGIISGVGGVLIFLPNILILFFFISLFEDTGYMARAAFIMDRIMHTIGLHGKSFIPMVMGFGCNVPAIMATRTLENKSDRILTILINPLISCSARLPVYILLAGAFFGKSAGNVIFGIYLVGIALSIFVGQLFRKTLFKSESAPFVMELPPYRLPLFKSVMLHMWEKAFIFIKKIAGVILIASILIWFISAFPTNIEYSKDYDVLIASNQQKLALANSDNATINNTIHLLQAEKEQERIAYSYAGKIGKFIEPTIKPLGFNWKAGIALITGIAAKEIVVSTFGVLYHVGQAEGEQSEKLQTALKKDMTPLSALGFMLFTLIYIPCIGTLGIMYRELGSLKWTIFAVGYSSALAWIIAFLVFQGGTLLNLGV